MSEATLLKVDKLEVIYNRAALAIQGVSLEVAEKEIAALLGVNGAGKTTTVRAICGFLSSEDVEISDGSIEFQGEQITSMPPHLIARRGIIAVPEREKVFVNLTVDENLRAGVIGGRGSGEKVALRQVYEYFPVLKGRRRQEGGYLSGGERQMLAIGGALMTSPKLLVIDEMSLGLAPLIVDQLISVLTRLRGDLGLSFLMVEQNALVALKIADYGYVMENGRVVFDGTSEKLLNSEDIKEFYLGMSDSAEIQDYRKVKQYRRVRRWWG